MNKKNFKINKIIRFAALVIIGVLLMSFTFACDPAEKPVDKIQVTTSPTKTEYLLGETFSVEGGILTVTYDDGSQATISLTDEKITIATEPNMTVVGKKTITVRYGGKNTNFQINVSAESFTVTLNLGNNKTETKTLEKGQPIERPEDPEQQGYFFDDWYADSQMTMFFEFDKPISANTTIYARMLEEGEWVRFYFDYDQEWIKRPEVRQYVKNGEKATRLTVDPVRTGYRFDGWYTAATGGSAYDFNAPVSVDGSRVYARWTKTASGTNTYTFEAEDVNYTGMSGPSWSGTVNATGMIMYQPGYGASGNRFAGYLYDIGTTTLNFRVVSDAAVSGVTLTLRLSAESVHPSVNSLLMNPARYEIAVNGVAVSYDPITFSNIPTGANDGTFNALQFADYVISTTVSLNKGINNITLSTLNQDSVSGTTYRSRAPLVDCLKLTSSSAVFTWSDYYDLPQKNY